MSIEEQATAWSTHVNTIALRQERDSWKGKFEGEHILYVCQLETSASLRREIKRLRDALENIADATGDNHDAEQDEDGKGVNPSIELRVYGMATYALEGR